MQPRNAWPWRLGAILLGAVLLAVVPGGTRAGYSEGYSAYQAGEAQAAFAHWRASGAQGNGYSLLALGQLYESGTGIASNRGLAYVYYARAAGMGIPGAAEARRRLAARMSSSSMARAQALADSLTVSGRYVTADRPATARAATGPPHRRTAGVHGPAR